MFLSDALEIVASDDPSHPTPHKFTVWVLYALKGGIWLEGGSHYVHAQDVWGLMYVIKIYLFITHRRSRDKLHISHHF